MMKKLLAFTLSMVLVLAFCASACADVIYLDQTRLPAQAVATVSVTGEDGVWKSGNPTRLYVRHYLWSNIQNYNRYKAIRKQLDKVKPAKQKLFEQRHSRELALYEAAARYLKELKDGGEVLTPKAWEQEIAQLTVEKEANPLRMKAIRDELKAAEQLRKAANLLARQDQHHKKEEHEL